ncbi:MAG: carboxypeptidase regulatory-like domain-containing protein [Candidatus Marinimicrobia bacterium]|nr:carboxypeptidase regulatory-like domain-containing protein [Candidatus Neomarinimicrobiota bacterium]
MIKFRPFFLSLIAILFFSWMSCTTVPTENEELDNTDIQEQLVQDIHGFITDITTGVPIVGASVEYSIGGKWQEPAMTDSLGMYRILCVNFGDYELLVKKSRYAARLTTSRADSNALNVPPELSPLDTISVAHSVQMYPLNASLSGTIAGAFDESISDASVQIQFLASARIYDSSIITSATTNESGVFSFSELPAGLVADYSVAPYDADQDGAFDFGGIAGEISLLPGDNGPLNLVLTQNLDEVFVTFSNLSDDSLGVDENVDLYFNQPISQEESRFRLVDSLDVEVPVDIFFQSETHVQIDPAQDFNPGANYTLEMFLVSQSGVANEIELTITTLSVGPVPKILYENLTESETFIVSTEIELVFSVGLNADISSFQLYDEMEIGTLLFPEWGTNNMQVALTALEPLEENTDYIFVANMISERGADATEEIMFTTWHDPTPEVLHSSLDDYNLFPVDSLLTFVFSEDMDEDLTEFALRDENLAEVGFAAIWSSLNSVTLELFGQLEEATDYTLDINLVSSGGNTASASYEFRTVSTVAIPQDVTDLSIDNYDEISPADFDATDFDLSWQHSEGAEFYRIYAKDSRDNSDWVLIGENHEDTQIVTRYASFELPEQFDVYQNDNPLQTPLTDSTIVYFAVTPVNSSGERGISESTKIVSIFDTKKPTLSVIYSTVALETNGEGNVIKIEIRYSASEYMSTVWNLSNLITVRNASNNYVVESYIEELTPNADYDEFYFVIVVENYEGIESIELELDDLFDNSGNKMEAVEEIIDFPIEE